MSVLQAIIAARSCVDVPNDVKFANSLKSFNQMLHLHGICVCLLGSSVVVNFPMEIHPGLGWVREIEDAHEQRDPRLIGAIFQRDCEKEKMRSNSKREEEKERKKERERMREREKQRVREKY